MRKSSYEHIFPAAQTQGRSLGQIHYVPAPSTPYRLRVERTEEIKADYSRHYHDLDGSGARLLFVYQDSEETSLSYRFNAWFKHHVLAYPFIFILTFGLFYYTGYFQIHLVREKFVCSIAEGAVLREFHEPKLSIPTFVENAL